MFAGPPTGRVFSFSSAGRMPCVGKRSHCRCVCRRRNRAHAHFWPESSLLPPVGVIYLLTVLKIMDLIIEKPWKTDSSCATHGTSAFVVTEMLTSSRSSSPSRLSLRKAPSPPQSRQLKLQVIVCVQWRVDPLVPLSEPESRLQNVTFIFFFRLLEAGHKREFFLLRFPAGWGLRSSLPVCVSLINLTPVTFSAFKAPVSRDGWVLLMQLYSLLGDKARFCSILLLIGHSDATMQEKIKFRIVHQAGFIHHGNFTSPPSLSPGWQVTWRLWRPDWECRSPTWARSRLTCGRPKSALTRFVSAS